jgi:hypothetical protein
MSDRIVLVPVAIVLGLGALAFDLAAGVPFADATPPPETSTCTDNPQWTCGQPGDPGCPGNGGQGGLGGTGGGAVIALVAVGTTTVTMTNGAFVLGHAGNGGPGGSGELGDPGEDGGLMQSIQCNGPCPCTTSTTLNGGSPGLGGPGGQGGQGGGGAGGPVYFYAEVNGGSITPSPATLASSVLGTPGDGGAPNGVTGLKDVHP